MENWRKSTWLIHQSYLKANNRKVISYDEFKNSMLEMINHPSISKITNYTPVDMVRKLRDNIGDLENLYELQGGSYIFYGDGFNELKDRFLNSITIYNCESSIFEKMIS